MILYADEYQMLKHDRDTSLLEVNWTDASSRLREETYKSRMQDFMYCIEHSKPLNLLANFEQLIYTGSTNIETWLDKQIYSKISNSGVRKMAIVKSQDILTQLLIEELMKNADYKHFAVKSFDNEDMAKDWLCAA